MPNLADIVQSYTTGTNDTLHSFRTLLRAVGMEYILEGMQPVTLFAPTDAVFARLQDGSVYRLLKDCEKLNTLMGYHIVYGAFTRAGLLLNASSPLQATPSVNPPSARQTHVELEVDTIADYPLSIVLGESFSVQQARVIDADIMADNGVMHVVDAILWPPDLNMAAFHGGVQLSDRRQVV